MISQDVGLCGWLPWPSRQERDEWIIRCARRAAEIYILTKVITQQKKRRNGDGENRYYNTTRPNKGDVIRSGNERGKEIFSRNKALFMSLFPFDVILLSDLYVTIVLTMK